MTDRDTVERALDGLKEDFAAPCDDMECGSDICVVVRAYRALLAERDEARRIAADYREQYMDAEHGSVAFRFEKRPFPWERPTEEGK